MRFILAAILLGIVVISTLGCAEKRALLEPRAVVSAEILKKSDVGTRRLGEQEAFAFVNLWNEAKAIGRCKFAFEYKIYLHFLGGRSIEFRTNGRYIAEDHYCFAVAQDGFFDQIWESAGSRQ